ncbi:CST complex subunit CTC1 isoform 2-T4 [Pholidichthys leucotaenia]
MSLTHSLPVSYRFLSVSQLVSQQHLSCVSNLSWSTNQQRAWDKEAELTAPGHRALTRVNLLLIGCLTGGRGGEWRLTDSSGSVRCECVSPSPLWLNRPVFLPHWNYISHDASGQDQEGGFLELIGCPELLLPDQGLAAVRGGGAVGVSEAAGLVRHRVRGQRVSVFGQVGSLCPLLVVGGTPFFCFTLMDSTTSLPVLVKEVSHLWWSGCVTAGQTVCVTVLRVCVLRRWRGNHILCVTEDSQLHADYTPIGTPTPVDIRSNTPVDSLENTPVDSQMDVMSQPQKEEEDSGSGEEAEPNVRIKQSRVISYQGTVTEVVNEGAGLYVMDGKVGLCLAYQPTARRKLRLGDRLELHHVHFLFRPCPDFPPSMLCACLRSTIRITAFSRVGGTLPSHRCPGDGLLPRLLLQNNRGVAEYLWACHLSSQLSVSLVHQQCVCILSWRLMEMLRTTRRQRPRDIYTEMLDEPHVCPLSQYHVDPSVPQYLSVSDLIGSLKDSCWSSMSLRSLLPTDASGLTRSQINSSLSWSCRTLSSDPQAGDSLRRRPLLLVGVLELPSKTSELKHVLQLRDATAAVCCVVTETREGEEEGQRSCFNTAWIGCLVGVLRFTMVTERFVQSDFPSYQHLDQDRFITDKHCRIYLQFSLSDLHILSPSVAMETHLRYKGPGGNVAARKQTEEEEEERVERKRRKRREEPDSSCSASSVTLTTDSKPCVSMVIRVEQKEGMAWRNTGVGQQEGEEEAGLRLGFSVRAALIGSVVTWGRDPKNGPMTEQEAEGEGCRKVALVFSGVCSRWFPILQSGCFYRLVVANTADPSILIGCGVPGRSGVDLHVDSTLQVRSDWRFHTLTRPLLLNTCGQAPPPAVLTVSDVYHCRSDLVGFQGVVSERLNLSDRTTQSGLRRTGSEQVCPGLRLTLCDLSGRSLQVYLDLSHAPYPPGLLPGNTLLLSGFQRRLSRTGSVYCSSAPISCVTVTAVSPHRWSGPPPSPRMHLGGWSVACEEGGVTVAQVRGHVVCLLLLQLQWVCSDCGRKYTQSCSHPQCDSTSSVFQSSAKLVIDDGTGEAHVWVSGGLVRPLLGLDEAQWEGLQRALRVRGHIRVYPRGRSLVTDEADSDWPLLGFLLSTCSSVVTRQSLVLTCRRKFTRHTPEDVRRFSRGDRDFLTRLTRPPQLTCLSLTHT